MHHTHFFRQEYDMKSEVQSHFDQL